MEGVEVFLENTSSVFSDLFSFASRFFFADGTVRCFFLLYDIKTNSHADVYTPTSRLSGSEKEDTRREG